MHVIEMIEASDAALLAFESADHTDRDAAERRYLEAYRAAVQARPQTLAEIATWFRWALKERAFQDSDLDMPETVEHIAGRLEALAVFSQEGPR